MEYKGCAIEEDNTGFAPKHLRFSFFSDSENILGNGESVDSCKKQIDELCLEGIKTSALKQRIVKYEGIASLELEMTQRVFMVFERRKAVANEIVNNNLRENQLMYAEEEIKYLDKILKQFLFID